MSDIEIEEQFEEENKMRPGTISRIRDQLLGTGLSDNGEINQSEYYKLLGETMTARDEALEALDLRTKKEKKDLRKKEKRKKKKEAMKAKSPNSQDDDEEEMEEEEEEEK